MFSCIPFKYSKQIRFKNFGISRDATNLSMGGGIIHLQNILHLPNLRYNPFDKKIFWCQNNFRNLSQSSFLDLRKKKI